MAFLDQSIGWQNGDFLLVCGDFGFVFEDSQPEHDFLDELEAKPYTLCFLDGNHKNFPALFATLKKNGVAVRFIGFEKM